MLRRHLVGADALPQETLLGIFCDERGSALAALRRQLDTHQREAALWLAAAVTFQALAGEDRRDLFVKVDVGSGRIDRRNEHGNTEDRKPPQ